MFQIRITNKNKLYFPVVEGGVTWSTELKSAPGTLKFTVVQDNKLNVEEGNVVEFIDDTKGIFYGFLFKMEWSKSGLISMTAYDQLRYFKNKNNYVYQNKTTSELVKMIAHDFQLKLGNVTDTSYKMSRCESDSALFDIFNNSNDETIRVMGERYVLYDDFGKLTLKNCSQLMLNLLIYERTAGDFTLTSSIDDETYNQIKLTYDNKKTGTREIFIEKDNDTIARWGVLQYLETIDDPKIAKSKLIALLKYYNNVTKTLKFTNCFGDTRVRGGCYLLVKLETYHFSYCNYMLVESVQHTFQGREHTMDLTLRGGEVNGG